MNDITISLKKFPLEEIYKSFEGVPFENSDFQEENFATVNAGITPERAFRSVCLRLRAKLAALQEAYYGQKKLLIDLEELQEKIDNPQTNKFDRARAEIDLEQKQAQKFDSDKLIGDALHTVEFLYGWWQKLPHPTRAEFEAKEEEYFIQSMYRQTHGLVGPRESLVNMGYIEEGEKLNRIPKLTEIINRQLEQKIDEKQLT